MKNGARNTLFALLALVSMGTPFVAEAAPNPSRQGVGSQQGVAAQISRLLRRHPHGGKELAKAIEALLERDPNAIADVIAAAGSASDKEQSLALELGVAQALAAMKESNPSGAQTIQSYLDANKTNPVVADILKASGSAGSVAGGGGGGGGAGGGAGSGGGGGGFVGGGGTTVSIH